jgi:hypothetical protein
MLYSVEQSEYERGRSRVSLRNPTSSFGWLRNWGFAVRAAVRAAVRGEVHGVE